MVWCDIEGKNLLQSSFRVNFDFVSDLRYLPLALRTLTSSYGHPFKPIPAHIPPLHTVYPRYLPLLQSFLTEAPTNLCTTAKLPDLQKRRHVCILSWHHTQPHTSAGAHRIGVLYCRNSAHPLDFFNTDRMIKADLLHSNFTFVHTQTPKLPECS